MTNKKQSVLEQLKEHLKEMHEELADTKPGCGLYQTYELKIAHLGLILELLERVQASEAKLEALEERARQEDQFLEDGTVPEHLTNDARQGSANAIELPNLTGKPLPQVEHVWSPDRAYHKMTVEGVGSETTIELPDSVYEELYYACRLGKVKPEYNSENPLAERIAVGSVTFMRAKKSETK